MSATREADPVGREEMLLGAERVTGLVGDPAEASMRVLRVSRPTMVAGGRPNEARAASAAARR